MAVYTAIDDPEAYFQVQLYTGDGSSHAITLGGDTDMQPDLVWSKSRSNGSSHTLADAVRGVTKDLYSESTAAEYTNAQGLKSFDSDGFTLGTDNGWNGSSRTFVAWCWKADGSGSANTAGSRDTTATSANTTSGFSICTLTTEDADQADTYGHGLGVVPTFIIAKTRSTTNGWFVYHVDVGNDKFLRMETDGAEADNEMWNDTTPTSTLFSLNAANIGNAVTAVVYCFTPKQGFSKFGSYTGNGNADGTFVYTGFKPAFVLTKRTDDESDWYLSDNKRNGYNGSNEVLYANEADTEKTVDRIDILSNGFKLRSTGSGVNASGGTFVYMAFAEAPFVNSEGVPCNAR